VSYLFSKRTGWDVGESRFSAAIREARASGRRLLDLTVSNPTVCGFEYDSAGILAALGDARGMVYDPDPRGMRSAREAVGQYYAEHGAGRGAEVDPDAVVLTTSTSEAYSDLFRLLCNAGDEVLVPQPSYPLFDFLAELDDVHLKPYPLFYDFGWWIDFAELERKIGPRTRAIVVVHPNNPTGHATGSAERERLEEICVRQGLALIVDEVFLDYPVGDAELSSFAVGPHPALTFCLSGLSKIVGLPQMKVGWLVAMGPDGDRMEALGRLEVIADTFLSMNAPAQLALPPWLAGRQGIQEQIRARVRQNLAAAKAAGLEVLSMDGGWSAVLKLWGRGEDESVDEWVLRETGVIVHPGRFYGIAEAGRVVVSLITPREDFNEGVRKLAGLAANQGRQ
jgi:alanine-synthesizing transaminase